jgi:hypothetical protein
MSYNEKLCGYSYTIGKLADDEIIALVKRVKNDGTVDELVEKWGEEDAVYELTSLRETHSLVNGWKLMQDKDGVFAWVLISDSGESYGDIEFSASINDLLVAMSQLRDIINEDMDEHRFKAFAIDWYNGSDCPLEF